jgi:arylsulfatase A-like enzyme
VRNVVLITMDALRADAVGFGGAERPSSPRLDELAGRSAVFTRAYSAAPMTRRAFPALLSGRYPANIHFRGEPGIVSPIVHEEDLYMAEAIAAAGIETGSVLSFAYARDGKFDQGFGKRVVHRASQFKREATADVLVREAVELLRGWRAADRRFFLWIHFYEPHFPYAKHPGIDFGAAPRERYLGEVRWVDDNLGPLLAALGDDTAVVFTGDHGEEFGEHGGEAHGDLHIEDLHIPLLVHVPGLAASRFDAPASMVDVAPTILDLLGVPIADDIDGDSLIPWLDGAAPPADRFAYAEVLPDRKVPRRQMTIIDARWQLMVDFETGARSLYDLAADRWGTRNLVLDAPDVAIAMEERLRRHLALRVGPIRVGPPVEGY